MESTRTPTPGQINEWMRAVAAHGSRQAFASLFRHYAPRIKSFLLQAGCDEASAEEIAQETMVVLWRRAATFDPSRAQASTWLYTIARNLRIDRQRRKGAVMVEADEEGDFEKQPASQDLLPDALVQAAERERCVRDALAALPAEQALVLRLSFYEEHPHQSIARHLGIPLGTVKSRIRLAMGQLRKLLEGVQS